MNLTLTILLIWLTGSTQGFILSRYSEILRPSTNLHSDDDSIIEEGNNISNKEIDSMEAAWRSVPKPLLRIGGKGATKSHGNSLRELLDAHTLVKVKVSDKRPFDNSMTKASEVLAELCVANGGSAPECLQTRQTVLLLGVEGSRERIERGELPEPKKAPKVVEVEE